MAGQALAHPTLGRRALRSVETDNNDEPVDPPPLIPDDSSSTTSTSGEVADIVPRF